MNNNICVLFRDNFDNQEEREICSKYFPTYRYMADIPKNNLVICRYSCVPFYNELEYNLKQKGCKLINSLPVHKMITSFDWYFIYDNNNFIKSVTPKTWLSYDIDRIRNEHPGPYVVKGCTNSKKFQWNTHMYAEDFNALVKVINNLSNDGLTSEQNIIVRKYIPLETYEVGINGLPFTNEWRVFCLKNVVLTYGYYWSPLDDKSKIDNTGMMDFVDTLVRHFSSYHLDFYVLDVARTVDGKWILIEVNDAQMSGLSDIKPDDLYKNLYETLKIWY
jgi:hypothetical protein